MGSSRVALEHILPRSYHFNRVRTEFDSLRGTVEELASHYEDPLGRRGREQQLFRLRRSETGIVEEPLGDVRFVPLVAGLPADGDNAAVAAPADDWQATGRSGQSLA